MVLYINAYSSLGGQRYENGTLGMGKTGGNSRSIADKFGRAIGSGVNKPGAREGQVCQRLQQLPGDDGLSSSR